MPRGSGIGGAGPEDQFGQVNVLVAGLELGLEPYLETGQIDEMPSQVAPFPGVAVVLDPDEKMVRVVEDLVRLGPRGEIKSPQAGIHRSLLHELGIEVEDPTALEMPHEEVGIPG